MRVQALGDDGFGTYEVGDRWRRVDGSATEVLVPGFVDIHIHGAVGIDFMSATPGDLERLSAELERRGYAAYLPTTVTAPAGSVLRAIGELPDDPMIAGFHLEGPFISPEYPGAQPPGFIADAENLDAWGEILSHPKLKVVTMAPEIKGGLELVEFLTRRGVRVSIGHSNATFAECDAAFEAGARHSTHTFNAMRPLHHREAGVAGYALARDELYTELIYDRKHVSREAAQILIKCKPQNRLIAVSDSTMASGLEPGSEIRMWDHDCVVGHGEVRLRSGALAGSAITLLDAFQSLWSDFGCEIAVRATSFNPREALGLGDSTTFTLFNLKGEILEVGVNPAKGL